MLLTPRPIGEVTQLLAAARAGDSDAADQLLPIIYDELRASAARLLAREAPGHTLQPTALVHEAWFKLSAGTAGATDRAHYLGIAARAMRQVLVEHARRRQAAKRDGGAPVSIDGVAVVSPARDAQLLALDDALEQLGAVDARLRTVVELRFFAGLTEAETAATLGLTARTVQRDWVKARAWLHQAIEQSTA